MRDDALLDAVAEMLAGSLHPIVARLSAAEATIAGMVPLAARVEVVDARMQDLAVKDLGALRERVAIVETRAPIAGPPGKDGRDGLSVKDLDLTYDGRRRFTVKLLNAETPQARTITMTGIMEHRGVWAPGEYEAGDVVTWAGGAWHCHAVTTTGKPGESPDWVLMVKRGKDGKDARP